MKWVIDSSKPLEPQIQEFMEKEAKSFDSWHRMATTSKRENRDCDIYMNGFREGYKTLIARLRDTGLLKP